MTNVALARQYGYAFRMYYMETVILISSFFAGYRGALPCIKKTVDQNSFVCVCNATYCDTIEPYHEADIENGAFVHYETNMKEKRLNLTKGHFLKTEKTNSFEGKSPRIAKFTPDPKVKFQEIFGFGGALTDSVGILLSNLSKDIQDKIIRLYFDDEGLRYSFVRIPIGSCDYSSHMYTHDDNGTGHSLSKFSLAEEDFKFKIPYLKRANNISSLPLKIIASPWTAPKRMVQQRFPKSGKTLRLKDDYYQTYAEYFLRFLEAYEKEGIKIWALTPQNQPMMNFLSILYPVTLSWTPKEQGIWIGNHLGPLLHSREKDVKIIIYDENRIMMVTWISTVNKYAKKYVSGIAVHSYFDLFISPTLLSKTHEAFPDLFILSTEHSIRQLFSRQAVQYGRWQNLEEYVRDICEDFNNWVSGWMDWNIILNKDGGPNFLNNHVDSPIIVNEEKEEFYKQPMWYGIAHFSHFVSPGSRRIMLKTWRANNIESNAFLTPDNRVVIVLWNRSNQPKEAVINVGEGEQISINLSPKSVHTILYKLKKINTLYEN